MVFGNGQFLAGGRGLSKSSSAIEFCNGGDGGIRLIPFGLSDANEFEGSCAGGFRNAFSGEMFDHSPIELRDRLLVAIRLFADHPRGPGPLDP